MAVGIRDLIQNSGVLNAWLGNPDQRYEAAPTAPKPAAAPRNFVGNVTAGAGAIGNAALNMVGEGLMGVPNLISGTQRNLGLTARANTLETQRKSLEARDMEVHQQYKAGKLNKAQFQDEQKKLLQSYQSLSGGAQDVQKDYYGTGAVAKDYASAAGLALTAAAPFAAGGAGLLAGVPGASRVAAGLDTGLGAGKALGPGGVRGIPMATIGKITRNTLVAQPTIQAGVAVPGDIAKGDFKGAAINAGALVAPLGISAVAKLAPRIGKSLSEAFFGKQGFFDAVVKAGGPDMVKHLDSLPPAKAKQLEDVLRQVQDYNLQQFDGNTRQAGSYFVEYLNTKGKAVSDLSPEELSKNLKDWVNANMKVNELHQAGKILSAPGGKPLVLKTGERLIAGRFNQSDAKTLIEALKSVENNPAARSIKISQLAKEGADWAKNPHVGDQIATAATSPDFEAAIRKVGTMRSLFTEGTTKLPGGYFPAISKSARADFKAVQDTAAIERGAAAKPGLGQIGGFLEKAGISPRSQDPSTFRQFNAHLEDQIRTNPEIGLSRTQIQDGLKNYARDHRGFTDERQLTVEAVKSALQVKQTEAKAIRQAILKSYDAMSREAIGLSGKVENSLYKIPGYGTYRRIQGIGRYEMNPFFRAQERVETEVLSQIIAGGKNLEVPGSQIIDRIFTGGRNANKIDETINILKDNEILAGGGFGSQGAAENTFSAISARLSRGQQRSIAGLVNTMAEKSGKNVRDFVGELSPQELDNIRSVVQYPKTGFTSSNFAKTLNLLVFPSRYNIKLATMLGKELAKQPALVQIATLKAAADLSTFLNSDAGKEWKSKNSEIVGIISYLSPLNNLTGVYKAMTGQNVSVGDFGSIGGLPFGFISQLLQDTGAVPKIDTPYLNPKTGEVTPDQVPTSIKGAAQVAITDLVSSMYSFPGRTFGTDYSKTQLTQGLPGLKRDKADFSSVKRTDLTPDQIRTQAVLRTGASASSTRPTLPTATASRKVSVKPVTITPIYKGNSGKPKAPKRKIYGVRPGQSF